MKTELPQPGTNVNGTKYNALATEYPNPPRLDLGHTHGTEDLVGGVTGGIGEAESEHVGGISEGSSPLSTLPNSVSALDCWSAKHGGGQ